MSAAAPENKPPPKRRWRKLGLFLFILIVVAIPGYGIFVEIESHIPGVTLANYRRLKPGMTEQEIQSFLGPKGGKVRNDGWEFDGWEAENPHPWTCSWYGENVSVHVEFTSEGRADGMRLFRRRHDVELETGLDKLRHWLGLK